MGIGVQIIEMKERELVASLKSLVNFQPDDMLECIKKGLVVVATRNLKATAVVGDNSLEDINNEHCSADSHVQQNVTSSSQGMSCDESIVVGLSNSSLQGMKELKSEEIVQEVRFICFWWPCGFTTVKNYLFFKKKWAEFISFYNIREKK